MKIKKDHIYNKLSEFRKEFHRQMVTLFIGAISFVAALFWRDAIQEIFSYLIPKTTVLPKLISALIVSTFAVVIIIIISQFSKETGKK